MVRNLTFTLTQLPPVTNHCLARVSSGTSGDLNESSLDPNLAAAEVIYEYVRVRKLTQLIFVIYTSARLSSFL